jgi:REP element-mobilizing transposase RayT
VARRNRVCPAGVAQHLIQRGNNRQPFFSRSEDFAAYAHWLREASERFQVAIHAWVFMSNHVHLLVTPATADGVSRMMQHIGVTTCGISTMRTGVAVLSGRGGSKLALSRTPATDYNATATLSSIRSEPEWSRTRRITAGRATG